MSKIKDFFTLKWGTGKSLLVLGAALGLLVAAGFLLPEPWNLVVAITGFVGLVGGGIYKIHKMNN